MSAHTYISMAGAISTLLKSLTQLISRFTRSTIPYEFEDDTRRNWERELTFQTNLLTRVDDLISQRAETDRHQRQETEQAAAKRRRMIGILEEVHGAYDKMSRELDLTRRELDATRHETDDLRKKYEEIELRLSLLLSEHHIATSRAFGL